ncbi:MAG: heme peroxidase family protein [Actinomycetota bacterium]|nr:heme peroxidase family protein [Actinomycetota bacterium]
MILQPADSLNLQQVDEIISNGGRGEDAARLIMLNMFLGPNRFGKMFPQLDPFRPPDEALEALGSAMVEAAPQDPLGNLSSVAAGFTYLGQFIDHDLSFDKTEGFPQIEDRTQIEQGRTPTLELDSLYGLGPSLQAEFYEGPRPRARFRIGLTSAIPSSGGIGQPDVPPSLPNDLPRRPNKEAVIGDPRNDENLIVAQTHLAFMKFHNRVMASGPQGGQAGPGTPFERTQRLVRWHYQWIILHDFLPKVIDPSILNDVKANGRRFYNFDADPFSGTPFMPLEFSAAAYRLGHSMIRESYNYNRVFADRTVEPTALTEATLRLLFAFTGSGGFPAPPGTHPVLPSNWIIDWRRFFELGRPDLLNFARRLDTTLVPELHDLQVSGPRSLAVRNLLRGSRVGLPAGQDVADAIADGGVEVATLTPDQVAGGADGPVLREHGLHERTPLWYYVLKEAEVQAGGQHLGQVGSRIVAEVFIGLLEGDNNSFLSQDPAWKPTLPAATPGTFTMPDLLRFVNDINPIG